MIEQRRTSFEVSGSHFKYKEIREGPSGRPAGRPGPRPRSGPHAFLPRDMASAACVARRARHDLRRGKVDYVAEHVSEGGMIRLETLMELNFLNSSFSRLSSY